MSTYCKWLCLLSLLIYRFQIINVSLQSICWKHWVVYPGKFTAIRILRIAYSWPCTYFSVLFISYKLVIVSESCINIFLRKWKKIYRYTLVRGMELLVWGDLSGLAFWMWRKRTVWTQDNVEVCWEERPRLPGF